VVVGGSVVVVLVVVGGSVVVVLVVVGGSVVVVLVVLVVLVVVGGSVVVGATDDPPPEQALAARATSISADLRMPQRYCWLLDGWEPSVFRRIWTRVGRRLPVSIGTAAEPGRVPSNPASPDPPDPPWTCATS